MTFRLSPVIEGSSYIFFDPEGFAAVAGHTITSNQLEAGDTQIAVIGDPIITPDDGDTVLTFIDRIGISLVMLIDNDGEGVEAEI